jgi:hypothetical protein
MRHPKIHQNDIWSQLSRKTYGHLPTGSLRNNFNVLVGRKRGRQANAEQIVVVSHENAS